MDLSKFVSSSIVSIVQAISDADKTLQEQQLGKIWKEDLQTHAKELVNVRIVKGKTSVDGVSIPVMLVDFDVNVTVGYSGETMAKAAVEGNIGAASSLLQIVGVSGGAKGSGEATLSGSRSDVQNLKFTVPVLFHKKD